MSFRDTQNPGIGGLDEITDAEALFLQNLTGLSYAAGDILYHDGNDLTNLGKGSDGEVLTLAAGIPSWAAGGGGSGDLLADGTIPLTADWDVGAFKITAEQLASDVATGTAPLVITSTTKVDNLHGARATLADTVTTITGLAPDTATTQATQASITTCANLVSVGALASGSIASGFGTINIGTSNAVSCGTVELGHATDTTLSRVSAGLVAIEGNNILTANTGLALSGGTMTGDIQLGETDIKLDAVLSEDETWSGIVIAVTLGSTVAQGEVCFLASDGKWDKNDGILDGTDTGFSKQLGICLVAGDDTDASEMLLYGKVRSAGFPPTFTVGAPVYLDDTAGNLVVSQPSTTNFAIRICGYAITATDLLFNPSNDYIVHS